MIKYTSSQNLEITKIILLAIGVILLVRINSKLPDSYSNKELDKVMSEIKDEYGGSSEYDKKYRQELDNRRFFLVYDRR